MCVVCGCSAPDGAKVHAHDHGHGHDHDHDHDHDHAHDHAHDHDHSSHGHGHGHDLHFGAGAARVSVPGLSQARTIRLEADILGENNRVAAQNRRHFAAHGVTALNLLSSPGSGKTTLLCATLNALRARHPELPTAVIEGDQQTSFDADRIRATGVPAIQVNTGKGCHLDAPMVAEAFAQLHDHAAHAAGSLLFIENVGNLVCPALWDLGELAKVVVLSVTEGEDKPLKYPDMFAAADLMLVNKIDLLPHLDFDVARCIEAARRVHPTLAVLQVSARSGEGMDAWIDWVLQQSGMTPSHPGAGPHTDVDLRARVAALEAELARARAELRDVKA